MEFTAGGRLRVNITPDDVGKRVSVRRRADPDETGGAFTDALGVLTSWNSGVLSITRRDGERVTVPEAALVAGKVVPAMPPQRRGPAASTADLERIAARGWPALRTGTLGGWTLRASDGFTRRADSVLALGDPGTGLDQALAEVERWYAAQGLPALLAVPLPHDPAGVPLPGDGLDAELARRGWTAETTAAVLTSALAPVADADADAANAADPAALGTVRLDRTPDAAWLARYHRWDQAPRSALSVLTGGPSVWFATLPAPDGTAAAVGRLAVDGPPWTATERGGARWAGFSALEVAPGHRRRGLGTLVMAALARRALEEGATAGYLQVEADNGAATAMYDRLGFAPHHRYHYRRAPRRE